MTTYGEPPMWLSQFPLGTPQSFACDYQGIRYPGEVVRDEAWSARWGEPLSGEKYFRIVLLEQPISSTPPLQDSRIALCVPGTAEHQRRDRLVEELTTLREAQALYLTQRGAEADLIRHSLQRRQEGLEQELVAQEINRYSSGAIVVTPGPTTLPTDLFSDTDPAGWFYRIALWLLERAYPSLPLNAGLMPRPITQEDVPQIYKAIFGQSGATPELLSELGPGLGLDPTDIPGGPGPSSCPVLEIIDSYLSSQPEPADWPELHYHLGHRVGLTGPLTTLYLLVFLRQHRQELEIRLSPGHELFLEGRALSGTRLTPDLVPALTWDDRLAQWGRSIGLITDPDWNDALPYFAPVCPDLSPADDQGDISGQELRLLREVDRLARDVARGQDFLELLERRSGTSVEASQRQAEALRRLSGISGSDFRSAYHSARHIYSDYRMLEQDAYLLRQLSRLAHYSEQLQATWEYLDNAPVPAVMAELCIDKRGLEAALAPDTLLRSSRSWSMLAQQVADFKGRYADAYRAHHQRINQSLPEYEHNLTGARLELRALQLLNTLPELGPPAGLELPAFMVHLEHRPAPCPFASQDLDLGDIPRCSSCGLTLEQSLPEGGLSRLLTATDAALGEKNRQLSNLLVERILQGQADQRLEDFLKIVQASDLSALSNTINEELVAFIRRMLA